MVHKGINRGRKRIWELIMSQDPASNTLVIEVRSLQDSTIDSEWIDSLLKDCLIFCLMFISISGFYSLDAHSSSSNYNKQSVE